METLHNLSTYTIEQIDNNITPMAHLKSVTTNDINNRFNSTVMMLNNLDTIYSHIPLDKSIKGQSMISINDELKKDSN